MFMKRVIGDKIEAAKTLFSGKALDETFQ